LYNGRKTTSFVEIETEKKAFGFNKKELMSVAAKIADNLTFADDVSDEDVKHKPIETESGKKSNSPQLLAALAMYRKTNSILIVAKLDRLSRNV
jgi:hypothetical protein